MKIKGILFTVVILLGVLFAVLNWDLLLAPAAVNLLFGTVQVPLGFTLLAMLLVIAALFFLASLWERAQQLQHVTQQERQIQTLTRKLERMRTEEIERLEGSLQQRLSDLESKVVASSETTAQKLVESVQEMEREQAQRTETLAKRMLFVRNELAAELGELESRLALPPSTEAEDNGKGHRSLPGARKEGREG